MYTFLMLSLMAILGVARMRQCRESEIIHQSLISGSEAWRAVQNTRDFQRYTAWCETNLKPGPKKGLQRRRGDPLPMKSPSVKTKSTSAEEEEPCYAGSGADDFLLTERINLSALLGLSDHPIRETLMQLLKEEYHCANPQQLLDYLDIWAGTTPVDKLPKHTDELASIELENPDLQRLWYTLLKGSNGRFCSLFNYVRWGGDINLQLFRMPDPLVRAMVKESSAADAILDKRRELLNAYAQCKQKRTQYQMELQKFVEEQVGNAPWLSHVTYVIGTPDYTLLTASDDAGRALKEWEPSASADSPPRLQKLLIR